MALDIVPDMVRDRIDMTEYNDQVTDAETAEILRQAERCLKNEGDFVEFGCYRGNTTLLIGKLLAKSAPEKRLFAYDSFDGLPEKTHEDFSDAGRDFKQGALTVSKREVVEKIRRAGLKNVVLKKAWFAELTAQDLPEQIAFAFIDGDFYASQRTALNLVSPRLATSGVIICHDYNNPDLPGASQAVDEFLIKNDGYRLAARQTLAILSSSQ